MSDASLPHCSICKRVEYDCVCNEEKTVAIQRKITHKFIDPTKLTPYEQQIWDWHLAGKSNKEIGELIGNQPRSVAVRLGIIKEKVYGCEK